MTVAFDAATNFAGTGLTASHGGGTPRGVHVHLTGWNGTGITAVDYGGVALSRVSVAPVAAASGDSLAQDAWFYGGTGIPTGTQTVTCSGGGATAVSGTVLTVSGAANTEIVDAEIIQDANATNPSVTLSLGGRTCWCVIGYSSGSNATGDNTPFANWTSVQAADAGLLTTGVNRYNTVASTDVSAGWTQAANDAVAIAVAISEVAAGANPKGPMSGIMLSGPLRRVVN